MCSILALRRQASMYLAGVPEIEALRSQFNPVQARLIPAHVTLCREDEIDDWDSFGGRIKELLPIQVTIGFGRPVRNGNLVFLPAVSGIEQFEKLRNNLLVSGLVKPRKQSPHITLIHPRNGTCTDAVYDEIAGRVQLFTWTFREIALIEQTNGGPWVRFAHFGPGQVNC